MFQLCSNQDRQVVAREREKERERERERESVTRVHRGLIAWPQ